MNEFLLVLILSTACVAVGDQRCFLCDSQNGQYMTRGECYYNGKVQLCRGKNQCCQTHVKYGKTGQEDLVKTSCANLEVCHYDLIEAEDNCGKERRCCCNTTLCNKLEVKTSCGKRDDIPTTPTPPCEDEANCEDRDVMLVIDQSFTIGLAGVQVIKSFLTDLATKLKEEKATAGLSVVTFGSYSQDITSGFSNNYDSLKTSISGMTLYDKKPPGGTLISQQTCTGTGMKAAYNSFIKNPRKGKKNAELWLVSDGDVNCKESDGTNLSPAQSKEAVKYAKLFRNKGVTVEVAPVGDYTPHVTGFFKSFTGGENIIRAKSFDMLKNQLVKKMTDTCCP